MYKVENSSLTLQDNIINDFEAVQVITKNNFRNRCTLSFMLVIEKDKVYRAEPNEIYIKGDRSDISHNKAWDIFRIEKQFTKEIIYVKLFRRSPRGEAAYKVFCDFLNAEIAEI